MKKQQSGLTNQVTFLLALTCGVVVANMYYIQPISIGRSTSIKIAQNSDTYSNFKSINLFRFFEKSS